MENQLHSVLTFLKKLNNQTNIVPKDDIDDHYDDLIDYKNEKKDIDFQLKELHELDLDNTDAIGDTLLVILQQFLGYLDYVEETSDLTKKIFREYELCRVVSNMEEFFLTPYGKKIKPNLSKRISKEKGQHLYLVEKEIDSRILAQEYIFLSEHRSYLVVADYSCEVKLVLNFDGSTNIQETRNQVGRVLEVADNVLRHTDWRAAND